jgi:hypothetical protein
MKHGRSLSKLMKHANVTSDVVPGEEADGEHGGDAAREGESRPALPRVGAPAQPSTGRNSDIPLDRSVTVNR